MTRIPVPPVEPARNRTAPSLPCCPSAAGRLLLLPLAALAGVAQAIGLGEISQQSALGAPLRVVVPVIAGTVEELAGECVRIVPAQRGGDGIPDVRDARIALERTAAGARIVVISSRPVDEPVLKLTLQAGCDSVVRREYVLLMDPVPIDAPVAREGGPSREAAAGASAGDAGDRVRGHHHDGARAHPRSLRRARRRRPPPRAPPPAGVPPPRRPPGRPRPTPPPPRRAPHRPGPRGHRPRRHAPRRPRHRPS